MKTTKIEISSVVTWPRMLSVTRGYTLSKKENDQSNDYHLHIQENQVISHKVRVHTEMQVKTTSCNHKTKLSWNKCYCTLQFFLISCRPITHSGILLLNEVVSVWWWSHVGWAIYRHINKLFIHLYSFSIRVNSKTITGWFQPDDNIIYLRRLANTRLDTSWH